ncbi:MAG: MFS transporter [Brevefilum sp.]|nr:MFS transporter [Brevefilum sp.]
MKPNQDKSHRDIYYFATYGICFIALGLGMSALGPMLPYLANQVGVSFAQISFLFTSSSLGYLLGSAGGGRLFDRFKGHQLMLIALLTMSLTISLIPVSPYFVLLLAVMFIFGISQGIIDVGGNVNLLWVFQGRVGPYMNALHFCFGVGAFLSPIILHNVMRWSGGQITWPFWTLALLSLPGIIGLWSLSSPNNPEKEEIEQNPNSINVRLVVLMVVLFFIYVGVEGGFGGWIFTYATETQVASETGASYMNSIFWGALTLGRLLSVPLARKIAPSRLLVGNFVLAILFLGLILLFPLKPVMVWVVSAGFGLALSSVFPTLMALGESRMKISGKVTGYFFLGSSLGGTLIPMVLGQIFEYVGSYQIMLTLFVITMVGLVVLISMIFASNSAGEKVRS